MGELLANTILRVYHWFVDTWVDFAGVKLDPVAWLESLVDAIIELVRAQMDNLDPESLAVACDCSVCTMLHGCGLSPGCIVQDAAPPKALAGVRWKRWPLV